MVVVVLVMVKVYLWRKKSQSRRETRGVPSLETPVGEEIQRKEITSAFM